MSLRHNLIRKYHSEGKINLEEAIRIFTIRIAKAMDMVEYEERNADCCEEDRWLHFACEVLRDAYRNLFLKYIDNEEVMARVYSDMTQVLDIIHRENLISTWVEKGNTLPLKVFFRVFNSDDMNMAKHFFELERTYYLRNGHRVVSSFKKQLEKHLHHPNYPMFREIVDAAPKQESPINPEISEAQQDE
jgi:CRISPR/Cas system type I-B associated protein Csh2 (Cas7 group RAMP superfamily)